MGERWLFDSDGSAAFFNDFLLAVSLFRVFIQMSEYEKAVGGA